MKTFRDHTGCLRLKGKAGRRVRRNLRRQGMYCRISLQTGYRNSRILLEPVNWRRFPHLCTRRAVIKHFKQGQRYHITVHCRPLSNFGRAAYARVVQFFQQQAWWGVVHVDWISSNHTAMIDRSPLFNGIRGDLRFLRGQYGYHTSPSLSVSM